MCFLYQKDHSVLRLNPARIEKGSRQEDQQLQKHQEVAARGAEVTQRTCCWQGREWGCPHYPSRGVYMSQDRQGMKRGAQLCTLMSSLPVPWSGHVPWAGGVCWHPVLSIHVSLAEARARIWALRATVRRGSKVKVRPWIYHRDI